MFGPQDLARVARAVAYVEGRPRAEMGPGNPEAFANQPVIQFVRVTGGAKNSAGFYPGVWLTWDAATQTWTDRDAIWVAVADGWTLDPALHYPAKLWDYYPTAYLTDGAGNRVVDGSGNPVVGTQGGTVYMVGPFASAGWTGTFLAVYSVVCNGDGSLTYLGKTVTVRDGLITDVS